jgi:hypothetical protein
MSLEDLTATESTIVERQTSIGALKPPEDTRLTGMSCPPSTWVCRQKPYRLNWKAEAPTVGNLSPIVQVTDGTRFGSGHVIFELATDIAGTPRAIPRPILPGSCRLPARR